jgi:hypothetical protein
LCTLGTVLFEERIAVVSLKKLDQERQDIQHSENPHLCISLNFCVLWSSHDVVSAIFQTLVFPVKILM